MKPEMLETKIAFYIKKQKILRAAVKASIRFTDWTSNLIKETHLTQYDLAMRQVVREAEANRDEFEIQPVNYALTEAGVAVISRSLKDETELFVVDTNGQCTPHKLSR